MVFPPRLLSLERKMVKAGSRSAAGERMPAEKMPMRRACEVLHLRTAGVGLNEIAPARPRIPDLKPALPLRRALTLKRRPSPVADAGCAAKARVEPRDKGSRPQRSSPVPWMREEGAGGGLDQVAGAGQLSGRCSSRFPTAAGGASRSGDLAIRESSGAG